MPKEIAVKAPARVCLFGDHQDYLELPIIACAIDRFVEMKGVKNAADEFQFQFLDLHSTRSFSIHDDFKILEKGDHIAAVLRVLRRYNCIPNVGYTITVEGNIPINAGLSSSSAVVVAWIRFLLKAFGSTQEITNEFVAKVAYEAEVLEHNSPGGKMDQYTISIGDIIYLKTDASNHFEKFQKQIKGLIVAESGIPKDTVGLLRDRKEKALEAIKLVKEIHSDFDIQYAKLADINEYRKDLPSALQPFFEAAIHNHEITQAAYQVLRQGRMNHRVMGALMTEHHKILRDLLKITTLKIDAMIDAALNAGAYGAKIVGSGGGGSICAIAPKEKEQAVVNAIKEVSGEDAYVVNISAVNQDLND